jgi:hypothetical protein
MHEVSRVGGSISHMTWKLLPVMPAKYTG